MPKEQTAPLSTTTSASDESIAPSRTQVELGVDERVLHTTGVETAVESAPPGKMKPHRAGVDDDTFQTDRESELA
ncbi:MAG: hypothetical protein ABS96_16065 [Lysobacteraceae bacterium SCN 69-123]|nr:MAG: hypothetical protein ABS96_16065 [Xanthomonadaceae bacterium SCN 69-123]